MDSDDLQDVESKVVSLSEISEEERADILGALRGGDTSLPPSLAEDSPDSLDYAARLRSPLITQPTAAEAEQNPSEISPETAPPASTDVRLLLSSAKLPQKIKYALFGNATCRALLIREGNKIIQACVLKNPKLQM